MDFHGLSFSSFFKGESTHQHFVVTSANSTGARRSGPVATAVDGDRRGSPSVVWGSSALLGLVFLGV